MVPAISKRRDVTPSARRLTGSLRDIGYGFPQAVADLVDNSISAGANRVDVVMDAGSAVPSVVIADDGTGMTDRSLSEALRFGSRRSYRAGELGRFGLGLKTASVSQCRRLTVVSRHAAKYARLAAASLDLDHIEKKDRWELIDPPDGRSMEQAREWLGQGPGTVVIRDNLDRVLSGVSPGGGWATRRMRVLGARTTEYLGMVFHRFIEDRQRLTITLNGEKIRPWNPFAPGEPRLELPAKCFEVTFRGAVTQVWFQPYVLPPRSKFSSGDEFERYAGPRRWNRQQGLYIYRGDRLIQSGGWSGIRAADEHTKLARAAVDFGTELDSLFLVNVAKSRVTLPVEIRAQMERPIQELCHAADRIYRRDGRASSRTTSNPPRSLPINKTTGIAIRAAAMEICEYEALGRIVEKLRVRSPSIARQLGW